MLSKYQLFRLQQNYRKAENVGENCKSCKHLKVNHYHGRRNFYKCKLLSESASAATDIRLSYVCNMWNKDIIDLPIFKVGQNKTKQAEE